MRYLVNGAETELDASPDVQVRQVGDRLMVTVGATTHSALAVRKGDTTYVSSGGRVFEVQKPASRAVAKAQLGGQANAPMPGQIVEVFVEQGQQVQAGQKLLVLEAMKMQHVIIAPFDGEVVKLSVKKGDQVAEGQAVALVEKRDERGV